jgi:hypothetical protein
MEHDRNERNDDLLHDEEETVGIDDGTEQDGDERNDEFLHEEEGPFVIGDGTVSSPHALLRDRAFEGQTVQAAKMRARFAKAAENGFLGTVYLCCLQQ